MHKLQTTYIRTLNFASTRHTAKGQNVPGTNLPYEVHLCSVAMEIIVAGYNTSGFNTVFAVQVALLHDTLEDTNTSFAELEEEFGTDVAGAVSALTKDADLPKKQQMTDCLSRIKLQSYEVWAVKLADRITNLQPPPYFWDRTKKQHYLEEARLILHALAQGNEYLAERLKVKIGEYQKGI